MASKPKRRKLLIIIGRIIDRLVTDLDNDVLGGINHDMAQTFKQVVEVLDSEDEANWSPFQNSLFALVEILGIDLANNEAEPVDSYGDVVNALG